MRFATIQRESYDEPAVAVGGGLLGLREAGFTDLLSVIAGGKDAMDRVHRWVHAPQSAEVADMAKLKLRAPLPRPPKIICIGLNYRDHAAEAKMAIPEVPTVFSKYVTSVIGHGAPIVLPKNSSKPDYEAEFAVVIGKGGRHIPEDRWREHVFGYTIVNDVSARDFQMATSQWMMGKTFDTFCPMGPVIVTADEIADPHKLQVRLWVNGTLKQNFNTSDMAHKIPRCIEWISSIHPLEPGDILATGTNHRGLSGFMDGDTVELEVEGLGKLRFKVKDELKRTWARTTRLEHAEAKKEGAHTPQLTGKYAPKS